MKTTIKKTLLVALMFGTLLGYAKETTEPTNIVESKRVKVEFNAVKKGQTITIKDENGITIYKNEIQKNGTYSKIFDLSALKNGNYTAELNKDFEILIKSFSIKNNVVTFLGNTPKVFKPVVRTEDNMLLVSKIAFNNQSLKVVLYYEDDVIFTETLNGGSVLNRVYKLSENYSGKYKVIIYTDNRIYVNDFKI
ncbi:DUF3244 domain-containing protein [Polaribacter aquimarinus]|uniref:Secretion system C-terminal sorting domain-containing protein n=1 Tax=Polaribacter aquimarinus TaxID=2100726 RepID=A0A2U2JBK5_9FLAO|nr:DUF3244 domain-containing protein [Polaribacter aquimarinus]PWG05718.1 hypothetical protein DIS07_04535 [Polaribacter aquimarinus]